MSDNPELRWRCRRGMKELDLLLGRYLDRDYAAASAAERTAFAALLEYPDPELLALLMGQADPADQPTADVVARIRAAR